MMTAAPRTAAPGVGGLAVAAPMDGLSSFDPTQGGYRFCDLADGGATFHPAADLNGGLDSTYGGDHDLGTAARAVLPGTVYGVVGWDGWSTGFGHHIWLRHPDPTSPTGESYTHYCHLDWIAGGLAPGHAVAGGDQIGAVGKSGNQPWAHLHFEVRYGPPPSLSFWPYGYSEAYVRANYVQPGAWWGTLTSYTDEDTLAMDTTPEERAAMVGYFSMYGVSPNMETALMKQAALAYKRLETPGPCLSDEYPAATDDGRSVVRQDFTGRTGEYDPATGGTGWVELNLERRRGSIAQP